MKNKILVIAVHPDDETLGCGGTLLKSKANGDEIHWLICTTLNRKNSYFQTREKEIDKVSKLYKFNSVNKLPFETAKVDQYSVSEIIEKISNIINKIKPNIIYLPFYEDPHSDHKRIFEASYSCTKSFRYSFIKKIYMMETLSETEFSPSINTISFIPNTFVDISDHMNKKIKIMKVYKSEINKHPFPRSEKNIRALASYRGSTSNCNFAESFILLKQII
jgi:LmbE family N-acetylglucosaminyl deacetylase